MNRLPSLLLLLLLHGWSSTLQAHQVPNMTVEASFEDSGGFELKVNLDPRVFLSSVPTSLPPVPADWILSQSAEEVQRTQAQASEHLQKHLEVRLGGKAISQAAITWRAMDGATNLEVNSETTETHLLGTLKGQVPSGQGEFVLSFAREAQVSLILLLKTPEMVEPKVQVLFPGETSRPLKVPESRPVMPTAQARGKGGWKVVLVLGSVLTVLLVLLTRRKRLGHSR